MLLCLCIEHNVVMYTSDARQRPLSITAKKWTPRITVAEARVQFGNPEERKRLPLEAVARGLMKT
jgi:hypothetical protein